MNAQQILDFWFSPETEPYWFAKSDAFDAKIHAQFLAVWQQAAAGELYHWRDNLAGRLAEIIILDQFSRNLYRDNPLTFAQDGMALILAQEAIRQKDFAQMEMIQRKFMLMPFMHSESAAMHEWATALFAQYTDALTIDFEAKHKAIIDRFGRYPHRNEILGRKSSAEEITFLQQPDSAF